MSHFTVLVIGDDIEKQLQPYHEFECTGIDDDYVQDVDTTKKFKENYKTRGNGESLSDFSKDNYDYDVIGKGDKLGEQHKYGYVLADGEKILKVISRTNPNYKWDWWLVGGRWTGFFKLKKGCVGEIGEPGIMTQPAKAGYADQCKKQDIDIDGMISDAREKAGSKWDEFTEIVGGRDFPTWNDFKSRSNNIDSARIEYNSLDVVKDTMDLLPWDKGPEYYGKERGAFVELMALESIATFAVIKDGEWFEIGEMGWWGMVRDEKSAKEWHDEFYKMFNAMPDDTLLTVVDCHI